MVETNAIAPEEINYAVQSLRKFQVVDIGTDSWLEMHEHFIKLAQQAIIEATEYREEVVKELLLTYNKLPVIVHEAFCVMVWRLKVLPRLLAESELDATFFLYTVLFHEASAVSLLETTLYHQSAAETLGDQSLDLIDYCVQAAAYLIGATIKKMEDDHNFSPTKALLKETTGQELKRPQEELGFKIGMRCLNILSFIIDKLEALPLSAATRLVKTHDVPCLLSEILHLRPWMRRTEKGFEKFIDEKWKSVTGEAILKVTKTEAQTWFSLRQLLVNKTAMENYAVNEFRQREIAKCTGLLNDVLLDQLPVLVELKQYLCQLQISGSGYGKTTFLLEELPEVRDKIVAAAEKIGWQKIIDQHKTVFLNLSQLEIAKLATRLNAIYNTDLLAEMEGKTTQPEEPKTVFLCGNCQQEAVKKCSRCQHTYYCSRDCQVKHWAIHKELCSHIQSFQ